MGIHWKYLQTCIIREEHSPISENKVDKIFGAASEIKAQNTINRVHQKTSSLMDTHWSGNKN